MLYRGDNRNRVCSTKNRPVFGRGSSFGEPQTLIVKRDNPPGHLKLFPEYRRSLELLNEAASRLAWMLRGLTGECGQEAHARQRGPADESKCARHNQKSTRTSQCEFYDAITSAQSCFLLFKYLTALPSMSYKSECQEKYLPAGPVPTLFLSRHSAQPFERRSFFLPVVPFHCRDGAIHFLKQTSQRVIRPDRW